MIKKRNLIFTIITISTILIFQLCNCTVYATGKGKGGGKNNSSNAQEESQNDKYFGNIISSGDDFLELGKNSTTDNDKGKVQEAIDYIYNTLLIIGIIASVIIGVVLGLKYMTESSGEQAKVKETLIVYVVGCIVTFSAFGIWKIVVTILRQL